MPDISAALADNHTAVDEMIAAGEKSESVWTTVRCASQWYAEHLTPAPLPPDVRLNVPLQIVWRRHRQLFRSGQCP